MTSKDTVRNLPVTEVWNARGTQILRYTTQVSHDGLGELRELSARDPYMLERKAQMQLEKWDAKWKAMQEKEAEEDHRTQSAEEAELLSQEATEALSRIDKLLLATLDVDDTVDWDQLKDARDFGEHDPSNDLNAMLAMVQQPAPPDLKAIPPEPNRNSDTFAPRFNILDRLSRSAREKKTQASEESYLRVHSAWEREKQSIEEANTRLLDAHDAKQAETRKEEDKVRQVHAEQVTAWQTRRAHFLSKQQAHNARVDQLREKYMQCDPEAVQEYCELVLNNSDYPDSFPKNFELEYNGESRILVVEYSLPPIEAMPTLKEVRYLPSKDEFRESHLNESQVAKTFDDTAYKVTLRTLHELFEADTAGALDAIVLNGWVVSLNKATGRRGNTCILSIQVKKQEFTDVDLAHVEPKACFKSLKGVGSSKLSGITPVQPVLQIDRSDSRFVQAKEVIDRLQEGDNLASMDWEDFEHLIREVFAAEFSSAGGEVKVTQASRDGGVDAVAFDPDPIRGGKIVIQAKRYTNTVGVSAVRDLYGTVMNEGATKGILVTTADYGPDAYEFAKGKPLTLLSGANLLHLLEKHGHRARIDLQEARKLMAEEQKQ